MQKERVKALSADTLYFFDLAIQCGVLRPVNPRPVEVR
jgi:hypothetical protein